MGYIDGLIRDVEGQVVAEMLQQLVPQLQKHPVKEPPQPDAPEPEPQPGEPPRDPAEPEDDPRTILHV